MRRFGRRTAIGATSLALLFAATGTTLAAVRSARFEGGGEPSGVALPAPGGPAARPGGAPAPAPAGPAPDRSPTRQPGPSGAGTPARTPEAPPGQPGAAPGGASSPAPLPGSSNPAAAPAPNAATRARIPPPVPIEARSAAAGPATGGCPSNSGRGALPPDGGVLHAVDFTLAWPGRGPLVLLPQVSASRRTGVPITIIGSTSGALATDGSSLSLDAPASADYTVVAGQEVASGTIRFGASAPTVEVARDACPDRSFVLHDVDQATLDGSPLRIVGVVATPGTVTVDEHGGIARFRSAAAGTHRVSLITANDVGAAGPVVTATVTVG